MMIVTQKRKKMWLSVSRIIVKMIMYGLNI